MKIKIPDNLLNKEEKENTPKRFDRYMCELEEKRKDFNFTLFKIPNAEGMVIIKKISMSSICAHHLLPFTGFAHIGYIPKDNIFCGASKIIRALEKFSSKPQTQEKLTSDVVNFLAKKLKPLGIMCIIEAEHQCMRIRGVRNPSSVMVTSEIRGAFKKKAVREEFLSLVGLR